MMESNECDVATEYDGDGVTRVKCNDNDDVIKTLGSDELFNKIVELRHEKEDIEKDFGLKRAKFRELFLQKEEELRIQREHYECETQQLTTQMAQLSKELDECRSLVTVAEYEKENGIEVERRKCREEIASIKHFMQEKIDSLKRTHDTDAIKLKKDYERLETELNDMKSAERDNILSVMTKSLKQKVGSLNTSSSSASFDDNKQKLINEGVNQHVMSHDDEFDMMLPFEEEMKSLKEKLRMTDTKLQSYELSLTQLMRHFGSDPVFNVIKSKVNHSNIDAIVNELSTVSHEYDDLEIYVAMLTTERTALLLQIDKYKKDVDDLRRGMTKTRSESPNLFHNVNKSLTPFASPITIESQSVSSFNGSTPNISSQFIHKKLQRSQSLTDIDMKGCDKRELKHLNDELKKVREKLKMPCEMCRNYELQLQTVQNNEYELRRQLSQCQDMLKQLKDDLKKEQNFRVEMEEKFTEESKRSDDTIKELYSRLDTSQSSVTEIKIKYNEFCRDANDRISELIVQHSELTREVERLTRDNDVLLGKFVAKSHVLQSEAIDLPQDIDEVQFYCLKLREELITTLVAKESKEDSLKSEILFLKEQLRGEQQTKETIEESLTQENDLLRSSVDSLQSELSQLKVRFNEQELQLTQCNEKLDKLTKESEQKINDLQIHVNDLSTIKAKLETETSSLRNKVQSLQTDLVNSETVQMDFVKLSQSLQIQLEKIRQSDSEVRWQHEDDATDCNSCKKVFHSRKEKSHCSHCGRVFCSECNSKVIHSGPKNRAYKVCSVCHTLLDNQTACWFASEPPHSPT